LHRVSPHSAPLLFLSNSHLLALFFFNDTAPTEIYTLSLHDALPIFRRVGGDARRRLDRARSDRHNGRAQRRRRVRARDGDAAGRSEEHTSELQSLTNIVCRLLLEKKK